MTVPWRRANTLKPHPKHRADDKIREMQNNLDGAEHLINGLRADRDKYKGLYDGIVDKANRVDEAETRAAEAERQRDADYAELVALRQFKANVTAVTAPPMERDTTGEDTLVTPIPVPEYGDAAAVRALWDAPFAAAPAPAPAPETVPPPMKLQFAAGASKVTVSGGPRPATA
jgi:hypothetical protein